MKNQFTVLLYTNYLPSKLQNTYPAFYNAYFVSSISISPTTFIFINNGYLWTGVLILFIAILFSSIINI